LRIVCWYRWVADLPPARWIGRRREVQRLNTLPFESAFGFLALYAGVAGLLDIGTIDPINELLGSFLVAAFQTAFAAAGLLILVGIARSFGTVEALGVGLLAVNLVVRGIAVLAVAGLSLATGGVVVLYAGLVVACGVRLSSILRADVIARVKQNEVEG